MLLLSWLFFEEGNFAHDKLLFCCIFSCCSLKRFVNSVPVTSSSPSSLRNFLKRLADVKSTVTASSSSSSQAAAFFRFVKVLLDDVDDVDDVVVVVVGVVVIAVGSSLIPKSS